MSKILEIPVIKNGEQICIPITACNVPINGPGETIEAVEVPFDVPAGLQYVSDTPTVGTFDPATGIWTIGDLASGDEASIEVCFEIVDDTAGPFDVNYTVTGTVDGETVSSDPECTTIDGPDCSLVAACETVTTLVAGPTPGTYVYTSEDGTQTTIDINEIDMDINSIILAGSVITFTAEDGTQVPVDICAIVAANCNATYVIQTDGSAIFTDNAGVETIIPAPVDQGGLTSTVVEDADGNDVYTITHTNSDGTTQDVDVIVPPVIASQIVDNDDGTITHTNGDGDDTILDICKITADGGCLPTITPIPGTSSYTFDDGHGNTSVFDVNEIDMDINALTIAGSVLTFTAEDGTPILVDVCAIVAANCNSTYTINADGTATYVDNAGNITTIPAASGNTSSVTKVTNADGTETFTHDDGQGNTQDWCNNFVIKEPSTDGGGADDGTTILVGKELLIDRDLWIRPVGAPSGEVDLSLGTSFADARNNDQPFTSTVPNRLVNLAGNNITIGGRESVAGGQTVSVDYRQSITFGLNLTHTLAGGGNVGNASFGLGNTGNNYARTISSGTNNIGDNLGSTIYTGSLNNLTTSLNDVAAGFDWTATNTRNSLLIGELWTGDNIASSVIAGGLHDLKNITNSGIFGNAITGDLNQHIGTFAGNIEINNNRQSLFMGVDYFAADNIYTLVNTYDGNNLGPGVASNIVATSGSLFSGRHLRANDVDVAGILGSFNSELLPGFDRSVIIGGHDITPSTFGAAVEQDQVYIGGYLHICGTSGTGPLTNNAPVGPQQLTAAQFNALNGGAGGYILVIDPDDEFEVKMMTKTEFALI